MANKFTIEEHDRRMQGILYPKKSKGLPIRKLREAMARKPRLEK